MSKLTSRVSRVKPTKSRRVWDIARCFFKDIELSRYRCSTVQSLMSICRHSILFRWGDRGGDGIDRIGKWWNLWKKNFWASTSLNKCDIGSEKTNEIVGKLLSSRSDWKTSSIIFVTFTVIRLIPNQWLWISLLWLIIVQILQILGVNEELWVN